MEEVKREMLTLSDFALERLVNRVADLGEAEYWWEPAPDTWSLRPDSDGQLKLQWGVLFDEVPPITTIAWRLTHIVDLLSEERCATWIGLDPETEDLLSDGAPATPDRARELLTAAGDRWRRYVTATDANSLFEKLGPIGRGFAESTRMTFILHIIDELIHHAAEVALLRDLYRSAQPRDAVVTALLTGDAAEVAALDGAAMDRARAAHPELVLTAAATLQWDAIPRLIDLGFSIDGRDGRTPLHHAAASGQLDTITLLLEHGADLSARDSVYQATPVEWAEFFHQREAVAALLAPSTE